jgi:hypothetical protein
MPVTMAAVSANYTASNIELPQITRFRRAPARADMWTPAGFTNVPDAREFPTAVWTGSENDCVGWLSSVEHWRTI